MCTRQQWGRQADSIASRQNQTLTHNLCRLHSVWFSGWLLLPLILHSTGAAAVLFSVYQWKEFHSLHRFRFRVPCPTNGAHLRRTVGGGGENSHSFSLSSLVAGWRGTSAASCNAMWNKVLSRQCLQMSTNPASSLTWLWCGSAGDIRSWLVMSSVALKWKSWPGYFTHRLWITDDEEQQKWWNKYNNYYSAKGSCNCCGWRGKYICQFRQDSGGVNIVGLII